jgi:hypothetical protein
MKARRSLCPAVHVLGASTLGIIELVAIQLQLIEVLAHPI